MAELQIAHINQNGRHNIWEN